MLLDAPDNRKISVEDNEHSDIEAAGWKTG